MTRRGRSVRLGLATPEGALLKLHCYGLDEERLWEVMTAMALNDKVTRVARLGVRSMRVCTCFPRWITHGTAAHLLF